ncbi:hypothetical protein JL721_12634 [Aureococcus anophagefferens]|nr:hypothetical protein JL721_12634 [Aureococcus anophagefferens]
MGGGASCDAGAPRDDVIVDGDAGILERAGAQLIERPAPARELRRLIDGGGLCAVVAPSGSGKSTFVASAVAALRAEAPSTCSSSSRAQRARRRGGARPRLDPRRRAGDDPGDVHRGGANGDDARVETLRALGRASRRRPGARAAALDAGEQAALLALGGSTAALRKLEGKADRSGPLYLRLVGYVAGDWPGTVAGAYDALLAALPDDAAAKLLLCSIWVSGGALFPAELVLSRLRRRARRRGDAAAAKRYLCAVAYGERKCAAGLAGDLARDYEAAARAFPKERAFRDFAATERANARPGPGPLGRGPLGAAGAERATHVRGARRRARRRRPLPLAERRQAAAALRRDVREPRVRLLGRVRVPERARVACGGSDRRVHVLDGDGNGALLAGHGDGVSLVAFSPSREHHLLSVARRGDGGSDAFLFDVDTAEKLAAYDVPEGFVCDARWAPGGERFALARRASVVFAGDGSSNARLATVDGGAAAVCFSADGASLLAARGRRSRRVRSAAAASAFAAAHDEDQRRRRRRGLRRDGRRRRPGRALRRDDGDRRPRRRPRAASPRSCGSFASGRALGAVGLEDRTARLICAKTGASHALRGHSAAVSAVAPFGGFCATAGGGGACVWDLRLVQTQDAIPGSDRAISGVVCRPDGSLVVADVGGVVRAFDAKSEAVLWAAPKLESGGHDAITSLALDADGARVACGAYRWLHVLDATTGASLAALPFGDWVKRAPGAPRTS